VRVRPAHRDHLLHEPRAEEWVLIEWPEAEKEPTKYWLSTLSPDTPLADLVEQAKLRWRIERDFQELKQEMGLGHYEGRGWRGFHHHAALCIAAYGFLVSERGRVPPSGPQTAILPASPSRGLPSPGRSPSDERHVETSITTLRINLAHALARRLPRCPCCHRTTSHFMTQLY
jgi:SRSO17 transposase